MLTDRTLKMAKPKDKAYKIQDRDGMYAYVSLTGTISFRYNYKFNGRNETLTLGKYGIISLAEARERLMAARKLLEQGISPAKNKQQCKVAKLGESFEAWFLRYIDEADFADSTRAVRNETYERNIKKDFGNKRLLEIGEADIRALCEKIKQRGAPSQAVFTRDIFARVFQFAILKGVKINNPAADIAPASIARFKPRDRALTEKEIGIFFKYLKLSDIHPSCKKGLLLILLTLVRKGEAVGATWAEIDFDKAVWQIPAERMKARRAHNVYLSKQAIAVLRYLETIGEGSQYVLPGRNKPNQPIAASSLNRAIRRTLENIHKAGITFAYFTVHDLRRTGSTLLHEQGYNSDWVEKALAHEQGGVRAVYNKAEYAEQRRKMLQEWADFIDSLTG